jgi:hypothetical protein
MSIRHGTRQLHAVQTTYHRCGALSGMRGVVSPPGNREQCRNLAACAAPWGGPDAACAHCGMQLDHRLAVRASAAHLASRLRSKEPLQWCANPHEFKRCVGECGTQSLCRTHQRQHALHLIVCSLQLGTGSAAQRCLTPRLEVWNAMAFAARQPAAANTEENAAAGKEGRAAKAGANLLQQGSKRRWVSPQCGPQRPSPASRRLTASTIRRRCL